MYSLYAKFGSQREEWLTEGWDQNIWCLIILNIYDFLVFWAKGPLLWDRGSPCLFSSVQSLSRVQLSDTPWITTHQASLSITNSQSSFKLMSIELVMLSSHLILCCPLFLLPPIPPSIKVFSNESTLHVRWPKYWSFNFSISPSKEIPRLISLSSPYHIIYIKLSFIEFYGGRGDLSKVR